MQQIELNDREIMFLSDALNEKSDEIKNEIEILQGELQEDNQNPELDESGSCTLHHNTAKN